MNFTPELLRKNDFKRKLKSKVYLVILILLAVITLVPLLNIFFYALSKGLPAISINFFTQLPKAVGESGGGMANAIVGSATIVALASLLGIPWGIASGIYLAEYGVGKLATSLRLVTDLLASIPSIVIGLFAYAIMVLPFKGFSAYAGAFALAIMMVPTVTKSTEQILKLVPDHIREAGLALGLPRWKVTLRILLRGCRSGILTGIILAVARIAGESAPLLFTAFNNQFWSQSLHQPTASLPVQIYTYAISPFEEWQQLAWAGAFVLISLVFVFNLMIRLLLARNTTLES